MYIYFDSNGTLKEIITERPFRVGDVKRNKIYVYWDGEHAPASGWVKYRKPDGTDTTETTFYTLGQNLVEKELPQTPVRNLKYFSYDHTYVKNGETKVGYQFYEITVPEAVLNSSSDNDDLIPTENNMIVARIRFIMVDSGTIGQIDDSDTIETLGAIVFSVETNMGILTDTSINETQYNYLLWAIGNKVDAAALISALSTKADLTNYEQEIKAKSYTATESASSSASKVVLHKNGIDFGHTSFELTSLDTNSNLYIDDEISLKAFWGNNWKEFALQEDYFRLYDSSIGGYSNPLMSISPSEFKYKGIEVPTIALFGYIDLSEAFDENITTSQLAEAMKRYCVLVDRNGYIYYKNWYNDSDDEIYFRCEPLYEVDDGVLTAVVREVLIVTTDRSYEVKVKTITNYTKDMADILLAGKINTNKIYDGLDQTVAGFVLDATQGKVLDTRIKTWLGASLDLVLDSTNYKLYATLTNKNGDVISTSRVIDLPLESVVVSGYYDANAKKVVLTLENGSTIEFSVADLVNGLQEEITQNNPLSSDLVNDENQLHKFVTIDQLGIINNIGQFLLNATSGTLTNAQYAEVEKEYCFIKYNNHLYYKDTNTTAVYIFRRFNVNSYTQDFILGNETITITKETKAYEYNQNIIQTYNSVGIANLLALKQDKLTDSSSIDLTSNVVSVKQSYIDSQFLTDSEMTTLISEVLS